MKIEIVEGLSKKMKGDNAYVKDAIAGKTRILGKKAEKTIVMTPEIFAKVFSPQRVKMILRIEKNRIKNIYQLAKILGRKYEAVHRDIKLLEGFGIIKLKKKDREVKPFIEEKIRLPEFLAA